MPDNREIDNRQIAADEQAEADIRTVGIVNLLLGIWLIITPYWFGYLTPAAKWNQTILGIVILVLAGLRATAPRQRWLSTLIGLAGIWAIIAPFVLNYSLNAAYWNEIIVGIVVAFLAFYNGSLPVGGRTHHGHA